MQTEFFQNGITMRQAEALFKLGSDALLLADFATLPKQAKVCDLCAGAGAVGLLLLAKAPDCRVCAVDLQEAACSLAQKNVEENRLQEQMTVVQGDLRDASLRKTLGRFDCVVCNPPYFPLESGKQAESEANIRSISS